jgi:hypothetical protein
MMAYETDVPAPGRIIFSLLYYIWKEDIILQTIYFIGMFHVCKIIVLDHVEFKQS